MEVRWRGNMVLSSGILILAIGSGTDGGVFLRPCRIEHRTVQVV